MVLIELTVFSAITQNEGRYLGKNKNAYSLIKMNSYDYSFEYGKALALAGVSFDGASNEACSRFCELLLKLYQGVCWFLGEESTADASLDINERTIIRRYLDGGGNLLISGSEHAYEMARSGGTDPWFFSRYLKARYSGDDAKTYKFKGF